MSTILKFLGQLFIIKVVVQRLRSREADRRAWGPPSQPRRSLSSADEPPVPPRRAGGPEPDTPLDLAARDWKEVAKRTLKEIKADRVTFVSAAMAYYMFLAVFPALIAGLGIMGLVNIDPQPIIDSIRTNLPGGVGQTIIDAVESATGADHGTSLAQAIVGIAVALWTSSTAFVAMQAGLDVAFNVPEERKFIPARATAFLLLLATGALVAVPSLLFGLGEGWVFGLLGWIAVAIGVTLLFSVYYYLGPNRENPSWQWVSPGGILGALIWLGTSALFGIYVENFSNYGKTYGAVSAFVVLILWLYLTSLAILIGSELNAELERQAATTSRS